MIEQYFSNTNESATIPILQKILEVNKAYQTHDTWQGLMSHASCF
jgi:hypothetical protein